MRKAVELHCSGLAIVREAGRRFLNMRHFDVQLIAAWSARRQNRRNENRAKARR